MVQTLELHRRKGHSRIVAVHLARQVLELGFTPFCYINEPNVASIMLFKSLGFVQGAESDWIFLTPQDE
jgi:predicted GNAT family acetyltransferase